jgi:hypothetical protein
MSGYSGLSGGNQIRQKLNLLKCKSVKIGYALGRDKPVYPLQSCRNLNTVDQHQTLDICSRDEQEYNKKNKHKRHKDLLPEFNLTP